ncbi:S8 family serine peptidase [Nocardioides sp. J2M5]|uniref:S8 family serine peptidase n=1 Tax=Nocardioides palaemonis TaxID=2829810 RepID=UPI001BAC8E92|nr:S8 family serine peptidase [Nocardioides palaemonis]MBS2939935.1 S8 family serine peptidase [Nocardioides palaemonis]
MSGRLRVALASGVVAAVLPGAALLAAPAHAAEDEDGPCGSEQIPTSERLADSTTKDNVVFDRMHVEDAQRLATGRGVRVAVVDSGVADVPGLTVQHLGPVAGASGAILSGHGTIVAGLIAGPEGVAPDASLVDVKVYDKDEADTSQGEKPLTSGAIVAGIDRLLEVPGGFDVVNISLAVTRPDPALEDAVARLVATGAVVVASAGNKEVDAEDTTPSEGTEDNDADVFPADYPGVVAVTALPPDDASPALYVVPNADTDVAAPTVGAISVNANGQRCGTTDVATSWAAAEVSGVLALLRQRFPRETAAQLVARLEQTTESGGLPADTRFRDPWTGAGVVQAGDALTRELRPGRKGVIETTQPTVDADSQAPPAPERVDLFGTPRAMLLWSGLGAGALLALAVMLRPLVRRR